MELKTQKLLVVYSTTNNNQGKKHFGLVGLMLKPFIKIDHPSTYFTSSPRGYEHVVQKIKGPRRPDGLLSSKFEQLPCSSFLAHLKV